MIKRYRVATENHFQYEPLRITTNEVEAQKPGNTYEFSNYVVVYCDSGKGRITSQYETFLMEGPFCVHIPKFLAFSVENLHNSTLNYLIIEYNIDESFSSNLENSFIHSFKVKNTRIHEYFNNILDEITNPSEKFNVIIGYLFNLIMIHEENETAIVLLEGQHIQQSKRINAVLYFIDNHFHSRITTDQMAEIAGLSPSYFSSVFKRELQETPNQYLTKRRMKHAHRLLESSGLSVRNIAHECGYQSVSHFSTKFSEFFGYSPRNLKAR